MNIKEKGLMEGSPVIKLAALIIIIAGVIYAKSFMLIYNVLGNFVEPRIMGKGLGLSALVVFLCLLVWGFILGPVGMFLSVPITMTIKIMMEHNENTRWIAILLGTSAEAKPYLKHKSESEKTLKKNSG